jgi:hypothetical protein
VTPPLSIQQGRPLPALPVSPPPPQLPPRDTGLQHAMLNRVGNGGTPTTSNSWMMPPPGRPAAPPPLVSSTNLDDDWENSSNDLQRRRVEGQHHVMGQQDDLKNLADAMAGFHPCKFCVAFAQLTTASSHHVCICQIIHRCSSAGCDQQHESNSANGHGSGGRSYGPLRDHQRLCGHRTR